jgi:sortase A
MPERGSVRLLLRQSIRHLTGIDWIILSAIAAAALFGLWQIGEGLYIKAKAALAQVLLERAWERALAGAETPKPWPWADTWPIAKISVPKLSRSAVVLNGVSGEAMAFGPGHHSETPDPGHPGTAVIAAHRDTHFQFLRHVALGDSINVTGRTGKTYTFEVTDLRVVPWSDSGIDPDSPGTHLALVTCWPFGSIRRGPLRYVVEAEARQISPSKEKRRQVNYRVADKPGPP